MMGLIRKIVKTKSVLAIIAVCFLFWITYPMALYASYADQGRAKVNDFLENELNINVSGSLKPLAETINSTDKKVNPPEVALKFASPNPKVGEEITVTADVAGISNPNDAYFVWFLKRKGDFGYTDIDQLHKNAIRAQVKKYFDAFVFDYAMNGGDGDGVLEESDLPADTDGDEYTAKMGGDSGVEREYKGSGEIDDDYFDYCYVYDLKEGTQYELGPIGRGGTDSDNECTNPKFQPTKPSDPYTGSYDPDGLGYGEDNIYGDCDPTIDGLGTKNGWYDMTVHYAGGKLCFDAPLLFAPQYSWYERPDKPLGSEKCVGGPWGDHKGVPFTINNALGSRAAIASLMFYCNDEGREGWYVSGREQIWCDGLLGCCNNLPSFPYISPCECEDPRGNWVKMNCCSSEDELGNPKPRVCSNVFIPSEGEELYFQLYRPWLNADPAPAILDDEYCKDKPYGSLEAMNDLWPARRGKECSVIAKWESFDIVQHYINTLDCALVGDTSEDEDEDEDEDPPYNLNCSNGQVTCSDPGSRDGTGAWDHFNTDPSSDYFGDAALVLCQESPKIESCSGWSVGLQCDKGRQYIYGGSNVLPQKINCTTAGGGTVTYEIPNDVDASGMVWGNCPRSGYENSLCDEEVNTGEGARACTRGDHVFPLELGRGKFTNEAAYGTNPENKTTTPLADSDAELVVGLGQQDFTWTYQEGDEITVVVEGIANQQTKHEDASNQIVFAMPSPGCQEALEDADKNTYSELIKTRYVDFDVADLSPRDCVINNEEIYRKPGTSEYEALNVTLSKPKTTSDQSAYPSGQGTEMKFSVTTNKSQANSGTSKPSSLYYEWKVTCAEGGTGADTDITEYMKVCNNLTNTKGTNLKDIKFISDFPNTAKTLAEFTENITLREDLSETQKEECIDYFQTNTTNCINPANGNGSISINTKVNESRSTGGSNFGQSTQSFTIFESDDHPIQLFRTKIVNDKFEKDETEPICNQGVDKKNCRVMNNEVIAITAKGLDTDIEEGMISWKVDNKKYTCNEKISPDCLTLEEGISTDTIILPISGSAEDTISVTATVNEITEEDNNSYKFTRDLFVVEPEVSIDFSEEDGVIEWKEIGKKKSFSGEYESNKSDRAIKTVTGAELNLRAELAPDFLKDIEPKDCAEHQEVAQTDGVYYKWKVDGEDYTGDNEMDPYTIDKDPGEKINISVEAIKSTCVEDRFTLYKTLGIAQSETDDLIFKDEVVVQVVTPEKMGQNKKSSFFATAINNAPIYIVTLVKMTLIMTVLLLGSTYLVNGRLFR